MDILNDDLLIFVASKLSRQDQRSLLATCCRARKLLSRICNDKMAIQLPFKPCERLGSAKVLGATGLRISLAELVWMDTSRCSRMFMELCFNGINCCFPNIKDMDISALKLWDCTLGKCLLCMEHGTSCMPAWVVMCPM